MTIAELKKMTQGELDDLFRQKPAGPIPSGEAKGTALVLPGTVVTNIIADIIRIKIWKGKVFERDPKKSGSRRPEKQDPSPWPSRDRGQCLQGQELVRRQGVHRSRLLGDIVDRKEGARRDPGGRAGLLSWHRLLGQETHHRLCAGISEIRNLATTCVFRFPVWNVSFEKSL